jgi:hypothetical protein
MTFRVALTFDAEHPDRPTRYGVAEAILAALERTDVRATLIEAAIAPMETRS